MGQPQEDLASGIKKTETENKEGTAAPIGTATPAFPGQDDEQEQQEEQPAA